MSFKFHIKYKFTNKIDKLKQNRFNYSVYSNKKANITYFYYLINFLLALYIFLYVTSSLNGKILLFNQNILTSFTVLLFSKFTGSFSIHKIKTLRSLRNFDTTRNKVLVLKWLEYFLKFLYYKSKGKRLKNTAKSIIVFHKKLFRLFNKLIKINKDIDNLLIMPEVLIVIHKRKYKTEKDKNNIINLKKTLIEMNKTFVSFNTNKFQEKIYFANYNYSFIISYIIRIIITSITHGKLL